MKIFIVIDQDRWGQSTNVVAAEDAEAACRLVGVRTDPHPLVEVRELDITKPGCPLVRGHLSRQQRQ